MSSNIAHAHLDSIKQMISEASLEDQRRITECAQILRTVIARYNDLDDGLGSAAMALVMMEMITIT